MKQPAILATGVNRLILSAAVTGAIVLALAPSPGQAQCAQWDVSGRWGMQQSNGYLTMLELHQNGKRITGTASYRGKTKGVVSGAVEKVNPVTGKFLGELEPGTTVTHKGAVSGSIEGNVFYVEISWEGGGGIYNGSVGSDGKISGNTYDRNKPSSKANWSSTAPMSCAPTPVSAAPAPKPIKSSGKAKPAPTPKSLPVVPGSSTGSGGGFIQLHTPAPVDKPKVNPTTTEPTAADQAPAGKASGAQQSGQRATITASPQVAGATTLTWDGGADHPYAEVWVGVDGADPTFVVEKGKGARKMTVEPGKTYRYILTDSGKELATVTVKAK